MLKRLLLLLSFCSLPAFAQQDAWQRVSTTGEIRWCADTEGGAPYVFPDERNPSHIIGFEMDFMDAVARRLQVKPRLVVIQWDHLIPALLRGDCDVAVNGLEITEDRQKIIDFSIPYFVFAEQISLRRHPGTTGLNPALVHSLADLKNKRVGTLSASLAESILKQDPTIFAVPYPSPVESYKDLELGRVDAVVMDNIIASWYAGKNPNLINLPQTVGEGLYGMGVRKDSPELRRKLDQTLTTLIESPDLKALYQPWNLWTPDQKKLRTLVEGRGSARPEQRSWIAFVPLLLKGAAMTVILSVLSMALAVVIGSALCYGRLFGARPVHWFCNGYIEVIRGTPLLIQLFLLYYGLPNVGVQLPALAAAILGMGLNYAAYEAEVYRASYFAVPRGQMDAARSLGMTQNQALRLIMIPQALRMALPPSTNDFIALFKDTSLVSIITVSELTRAYSTAATTTYRFFELGLTTAFLYFAMSFPLSLWSRRLEKKQHAAVY